MAEIKNVVKRNGQIVKFDHTKILNAITKANAIRKYVITTVYDFLFLLFLLF